jgi:hypothetical protein
MQMGSRLKAVFNNPQNSQSLYAPNASLKGSTKADFDTCLMAHLSKDGYAENVTTASAHPITEENHYKKLQTGK